MGNKFQGIGFAKCVAGMKHLFRLFAFIAFLTPFYAFGEVEFWLWKPKNALLPFVIPAENGDSVHKAIQNYVRAIRRQPELNDLLGPALSNFSEGHLLGTLKKQSEFGIIVANMADDYGTSIRYRRIAGLKEAFSHQRFTSYIYPVAGAIHLSQSGQDSVYQVIRKHSTLVTFLGGADVSPEFYTRRRHNPHCRNCHPVRDKWEMDLIKGLFAYVELDPLSVPAILAICRSLQVFNTFFGGSLIPDIQLQQNVFSVDHSTGPNVSNGHSISILETKWNHLKNAFPDVERLIVNSIHHQAAFRPRPGSALELSAVADDGIVEALEFLQGLLVQFHPELDPALYPIIYSMVRFGREHHAKRLACEDKLI